MGIRASNPVNSQIIETNMSNSIVSFDISDANIVSINILIDVSNNIVSNILDISCNKVSTVDAIELPAQDTIILNEEYISKYVAPVYMQTHRDMGQYIPDDIVNGVLGEEFSIFSCLQHMLQIITAPPTCDEYSSNNEELYGESTSYFTPGIESFGSMNVPNRHILMNMNKRK